MKEKVWTCFVTVWATINWCSIIAAGFALEPNTPPSFAYFLAIALTMVAVFWSWLAYQKWSE